MRVLKIVILLLFFSIVAFVGLFVHTLERATGGWIIGGTVHYSYNYGRAYNWESDYVSLSGFLKGGFHETKCGALSIGTFDWKSRKPTESNKFIFSEQCGQLMSLSEFIDRYSNGTTVRELRVAHDMPTEEAQIEMFNDLKKQGLLNDIRYKEVTLYNWDNIKDFILKVLIIPAVVTLGTWLLFMLFVRVLDRWVNIKK